MKPAAISRLAPADYPALAQALGDSPATVIPLHQLHTGTGTATCAGPVHDPDAVVIQANDEPTAFGRDAVALRAILHTLEDWFCVETAPDLGHALAALFAQEGIACRLYGDLYFTLPDSPRARLPRPPAPPLETRLLTDADIPAWQAAGPEFNELGFATHAELLEQGCAAGSFADEALVAVAHTSALSPRYADVGVYTAPEHRGRGLATCAAWVVMHHMLDIGRAPLWSTGEDNRASQRVAARLGLRQCLRRVYVIPQNAPRATT